MQRSSYKELLIFIELRLPVVQMPSVVALRVIFFRLGQTFQLSVLKMSEIGHNSPPKAGYCLPMAGSHLGGSEGMPPRKKFENLSP